MKKYIPHLLLTVFSLGVGYIVGGLVVAKKATQQAYYSNIIHLAQAKNYLEVGNKEKAERALSLGISGSLNVIHTFDDYFQAGMVFILPDSGMLLSQKEKDGIIKSIDGPGACMIEKNTKTPNKALEPATMAVTPPAAQESRQP